MKVTTVESEEVWKTPDGQRKLYEVVLQDVGGNEYRLKTYSAKIAQPEWSGEVESYINGRGDRLVRQPKKEEGGNNDGNSQGSSHSGGSHAKPNYQPRDDDAIRAQWAIGQAVNIYTAQLQAATRPSDAAEQVEVNAKRFYAMVDRVKGSHEPAEKHESANVEDQVAQAQAQRDAAAMNKKDKVYTDMVGIDTPIDLDAIPY